MGIDIHKLAMAHGGKCFYCQCDVRMSNTAKRKRHNARATKDHVLPRCFGGKTRGNVVLACFRCNQLRGTINAKVFKDFAKNFRPPEKDFSIADRFFMRVKKHIHG